MRPSARRDAWGRLPAPRRGEILGRAAALLRAHEREFGEIVQPKPASRGRTRSPKSPRPPISRVFMEGEGSRFYGKTMTSPIAESRGADRARADRRLRGDHAVQQPARRRRLESVSGAALRQRRRRQVARADAVHRGRVRQAAAGSRAAARRVLRRAGLRPRGRHAARRGRARRPRQLHRIGRRPAS